MSLRRVRKFVDYEVQSSLAWRVCIHWAMFLLCCALGTLIWTRLVEAPTESWSHVIRHWISHFVPFAIIAIALLPLFLRDTIKLSNRFAGPIVRVRRALSELADGKNPKPVTFRKGDFWQALQVDLNRVLALHESPSEKQAGS